MRGRGERVGVDRHGQLPGQLIQVLLRGGHRGVAQQLGDDLHGRRKASGYGHRVVLLSYHDTARWSSGFGRESSRQWVRPATGR
jgi:hypothetical protein